LNYRTLNTLKLLRFQMLKLFTDEILQKKFYFLSDSLFTSADMIQTLIKITLLRFTIQIYVYITICRFSFGLKTVWKLLTQLSLKARVPRGTLNVYAKKRSRKTLQQSRAILCATDDRSRNFKRARSRVGMAFGFARFITWFPW